MSRQIGPDVDLDREEIVTADGRRLTPELAGEIAERALTAARRRGRPSVTGEAARTPNLTIRIPPTLRSSLQRIADAQGRRLADIGRDALAEYAKRHGRTRKTAVKKAAPVRAIAAKKVAAKAARQNPHSQVIPRQETGPTGR